MYNVKINDTKDTIAYVIYMIMGSYFKKTVCKSTLKEKRLSIVYGETKRDNQIKMEERCINFVENNILGSVPNEIFEDMVEVHFVTDEKENKVDVIFSGFDWRLIMYGKSSNKGIMFNYKLEKEKTV